MRALLAKALLALAVFGLGGAWIAGSILVLPQSSPVEPPAPPGRIVHLTASDGVPITGSYWPGARPDGPAILLLHGVNSSRASFARHALWLHGLGYTVLAIDFRGHGESGHAPRSFGYHEARDANAAIDFLRREAPARRIGLIGTSLGGAAALLGEDGPLPVQAMVLQAVYPNLRAAIFNRVAFRLGGALAALGEPFLSYQSWPRYGVPPDRLAPAEAIRAYRGPVVIMGGEDDRYTGPAETRALFDAAPGPKELWLLPGLGHAAVGSIFTDEYRARVGALFARTLGAP